VYTAVAGDGTIIYLGGAGGGGGGGGVVTTTGTDGKAGLAPDHAMTTCESTGTVAGTQRIEAECAFGASTGNCKGTTGGQQGTQTENAGTTVGYIEGGDALWYSAVSFDGMKSLKLHYAKGVSGGSVEVRLDSTSGQLLGTFTPNTTADWNTWADATVNLSAATGSHTLYLVATGSTSGILSLDWLELSSGTGTSSGGDSSAGASAYHLNQVGFDTQGGKHIVAEGPSSLSKFSVVDSTTGKTVWCGSLTPISFNAWGSSQSFYSIDFTELTVPGTYKVQIGSSASPQFEIKNNLLFSKTAPSVFGYFKSSRADDSDVVSKDSSLSAGGQTKDVHGGWYDASGDISKYLSHLSYANYLNPQQIPLVAWALAYTFTSGGAALVSTGQSSAVQAEALWGADYLLRVLDPTGYFYINVFDGWTGEISARQICAFTGEKGTITQDYQSAMREGGGMSIAALARASTLKANGDFTSAQYLEGAEKAFTYLNTNGVNYADDKKENVIDDYTGLLAAAELYAATEKTTYLDAARTRATSLVGRLSSAGYFIADGASRPFWHASDAGLPVVALARYVAVETDDAKKTTAKQAIRTHLKYLRDVTNAVANPFGYARQHTSASATSFFISHNNETGYWWQGENARLGSLAAAAMLGGQAIGATGTEYVDLLRYAGYQLDWILGNNPYDICFMKGFGKNNPPAYSGEKPQNGTWAGGIVNGITGKESDGGGIQWLGASAETPWENWRWVEQWLPHSAWYLVAVTAQAK
jgi:hypothetical protein